MTDFKTGRLPKNIYEMSLTQRKSNKSCHKKRMENKNRKF